MRWLQGSRRFSTTVFTMYKTKIKTFCFQKWTDYLHIVWCTKGTMEWRSWLKLIPLVEGMLFSWVFVRRKMIPSALIHHPSMVHVKKWIYWQWQVWQTIDRDPAGTLVGTLNSAWWIGQWSVVHCRRSASSHSVSILENFASIERAEWIW